MLTYAQYFPSPPHVFPTMVVALLDSYRGCPGLCLPFFRSSNWRHWLDSLPLAFSFLTPTPWQTLVGLEYNSFGHCYSIGVFWIAKTFTPASNIPFSFTSASFRHSSSQLGVIEGSLRLVNFVQPQSSLVSCASKVPLEQENNGPTL